MYRRTNEGRRRGTRVNGKRTERRGRCKFRYAGQGRSGDAVPLRRTAGPGTAPSPGQPSGGGRGVGVGDDGGGVGGVGGEGYDRSNRFDPGVTTAAAAAANVFARILFYASERPLLHRL